MSLFSLLIASNVLVDLIIGVPAERNMENSRQVDAIVIGAGLGGLLTAAQLLKLGKNVVVLERLSHSGGRFTAKNFHGVQVSTGAVHMIPFGSGGVLAQMLRRLHVPHQFFDADVFGSFHVHGRQYRSRGLLGVFKFLSPYQAWCCLRIGYLMFLRRLPQHERSLPFDLWLKSHANLARIPQLIAFFQSMARFTLSLELSQVTVAEVIRIAKNMLRYGPPAIVQGGCGGLTKQLEETITSLGGKIWLTHEVLEILHENGSVVGVRVRNKTNKEETIFIAPLVVSDIGPRGTSALLDSPISQGHTEAHTGNHQITPASGTQTKSQVYDEAQSPKEQPQAVGLKVHILSDVSLIPHKGIMYCLDTKRIAGMVQPTNSDPSLAPEGKHLLISHQVIQSNNIEEERALALADLRTLFGETFDTHCRILTMGTYRGEWPVNRLAQGSDTTSQTSIHGLYLVGDAVKPPGYLMVEGVAQSVNCLLDLLDEIPKGHTEAHRGMQDFAVADQGQEIARLRCNQIQLSSRLNAICWLWQVPGNSGKKKRGSTFHA
jgi:phytoene dehydrogenase-like protein